MKKHIQAKIKENHDTEVIPCISNSHVSNNGHNYNIEPPLPLDPPPDVSDNTSYKVKDTNNVSKNLSKTNYEGNTPVRSSGYRRTKYISYNVNGVQSNFASSQNEDQIDGNAINGYYNDNSFTQNGYSYMNGDQSNYMYNDVYEMTQGDPSNGAYINHNWAYMNHNGSYTSNEAQTSHNGIYTNYNRTYTNQGPSTSTNGYKTHYNGYVFLPPPPPPPEEPKIDIPDNSSFQAPSSTSNRLDNVSKNMPSTFNGSRNFTDTSYLLSHSASLSNSSNREWKSLEQIAEPVTEIPDVFSFPTPPSSSSGLDDVSKNMPSTSNAPRISANIVNILSETPSTSNSSNREWINSLEQLAEPTMDSPDISSFSMQSSPNNGLVDILKNMPSTSKSLTFADILNRLSQNTSSSPNQEWIKSLEQSISQSKTHLHDCDTNEHFIKKCNNCEFTEFRLQFKKDKVREMRLEREDLERKTALLDKKTEKINNAIFAFGKMAQTSSAQRQVDGFNSTQDMLKKKIAEYLDHVCGKNGQSRLGEIT